jgi:hypothetical protein
VTWSRFAASALALGALAAGALLGVGPASAGSESGDSCLTATPPPASEPPRRLRFGVTPLPAGTVGTAQGAVAPIDAAKRDAALERLRPDHRVLVIRLTRLFMSEGAKGIRRVARRARAYARAGFAVEASIRYHPSPEQEGDIRAWRRFVRKAAKRLGRVPALVALTITNEVNLALSPNTSDGGFEGARDALLRGIPAADRVLRRIDRPDVKLGFSYAYRYLPDEDASFWTELGDRGTRRFRRALDYAGVQLYPGLFWPPALVTETAGEATLEALTLVRDCFMPKARLGRDVRIWITENGYATNLGHTEARQATELEDTLNRVRRHSRTLGVSDYRYFNLRDNRANGTDLFDNVGLLRADHSRKPAFGVMREAIRRFGRRG